MNVGEPLLSQLKELPTDVPRYAAQNFDVYRISRLAVAGGNAEHRIAVIVVRAST